MLSVNYLNLLILAAWILSGLYALKIGPVLLMRRQHLLPYYNLLSLFFGPLTMTGAMLRNKWEIFRMSRQETRKSQTPQVTIIDEKGNDIFHLIKDDNLGAVDFVKAMLYSALNKNEVSDIFIDPKGNEYTIRFREEGQIKEFQILDEKTATSVVSIIKVASNMDIAEKRRPQDGSFTAVMDGTNTSFRVASVGVLGGEKITMRVMSSEMGQRSLAEIGFSGDQLELIHTMLKLPSGMILTCGPTGSGKTSTLYAMLSGLDYNLKNVISIEDPIERVVPMISQMAVNTKAGITFASLLRNSLRQNPDVICLGEIRDEETAEVAVHAAQTGHLIIATLHSNDNIGTIVRLMDLGIPLRSIAASLHVIISQRLLRKLCPKCKRAAVLTPEQEAFFRENGFRTENLYVPSGCPACDNTGYAGRQALFEILLMDSATRAVLEAPDASITSIKAHVDENQGEFSMEHQAKLLFEQGETSWDEYQRTTLNV